jgi:hypothetical protein
MASHIGTKHPATVMAGPVAPAIPVMVKSLYFRERAAAKGQGEADAFHAATTYTKRPNN